VIKKLLLAVSLVVLSTPAIAQSVSIDLGSAGESGATGRLVQITALVTVLSLAPSLLVMVTAFTRIIIVLSLLSLTLAIFGHHLNNTLSTT
jgi:flagellar biosynthesis protein FliP